MMILMGMLFFCLGVHFSLLGDIFLESLEKNLGPKWSVQIREAWLDFYTSMAVVIQQNMKEV